MPIDKLIPMERNPRKMDEHDFEELKTSIQKYGLVEPLVFNKRSGHVVGGHQRLTALKSLGHTEVEVVVVDLSEEQELDLNLRLNRTSGSFDDDMLASIISDLQKADESLSGGFKGYEINDYIHSISDDGIKDVMGKEKSRDELVEELREQGFSEDEANAMADVKIFGEDGGVEKSEVEGKQVNERFPIIFWADTKDEHEFYKRIYGTNRKVDWNYDKFKEVTKFYLDTNPQNTQSNEGEV